MDKQRKKSEKYVAHSSERQTNIKAESYSLFLEMCQM